MKTVHFFAFYPHNLPKITDFSPRSSMNPKNTKSLHFDGVDGSSLPRFQFSGSHSVLFWCAISSLQISTSTSLSFYSCFYDDLLLLLWWFTPAFVMRWFNIYWITMNMALNLFLTLIAMLSCREYKIFWPGKYLFPAERILCSIRECISFFTRMKCILVKNEVYSRKECSWFS